MAKYFRVNCLKEITYFIALVKRSLHHSVVIT